MTPDNNHLFLYSSESRFLTHVFRDKSESEQVIEEWTDIRLSHLPIELRQQVLCLYVKNTTNNHRVLFVLMDGGTLFSLKIDDISPISSDDFFLVDLLDEDLLLDIFIPLFLAFIATLTFYMRRRLSP